MASIDPSSPRLSGLGSYGIQEPIFDLGGRVTNTHHHHHLHMASYSSNTFPKSGSIFDEADDNFLENGKRASLLEEFTRDEVGAASVLSNKFKSSFAREVVQNVRLSMSIQSPEHGRRRRSSRRVSSGAHDDISSYSSILSGGHDKYDYRRDSEVLKLSSLARRSKSSGPRRSLISDGIPSPCSSDESLAWSSHHQPSTLEVDSLLEGGGGDLTHTSSSDICPSSLKKKHSKSAGSSRASLESLKKACTDLNLNLNELDWIGIRNYLLDRDQLSNNFVINDDFYNAYNYIMSNKRKLLKDQTKRNPKESMKSDSGGEMEESCRSSDEEEVTPDLHDADDSSAESVHEEGRGRYNSEKESSILHDLSQKEAELLKLRVDLNVVSAEKEEYKKKYESLKAKLRENDSQMKEVEHLKWQLKTLENSRKTYESATERLMSFLEQVSLVLQSTSPAHKKFIESTRAEVSAIARKTRGRTYSYHSSTQSSLAAISRAESMPSVVHDRHGESPFGKRTTGSSTTSGSMCSLNSSSGGILEDHHLSVMTLGRKIKRSQSTQSKMGLPIVDEEVNNSLILNSSLLSLSRKDKPHSSTPIKPFFIHKPESSSFSDKEPAIFENDTTNESDDVIHTYPVTPPKAMPSRKEDLIREELSKQVVKPSTPIYQPSTRNNLSCDSITVDLTPSAIAPHSEDTKDALRIKAQKMLRSVKCKLAREKTLNITPKRTHTIKSSKSSLQRQSLQLLSHQSSFPGLPSFPVLAVSHTSPWNC